MVNNVLNVVNTTLCNVITSWVATYVPYPKLNREQAKYCGVVDFISLSLVGVQKHEASEWKLQNEKSSP